MLQSINKKLISFTKRAEKVQQEILVNSFVDVGPLFTVLSTKDNQIFYGRRGTGKTHTLIYLMNHIRHKKNIAVYIDMRNIGSTGGIYADHTIPIHERGTRLLIDTLNYIHDELVDEATKENTEINLGTVGPLLDTLSETISKVTIVGTVEKTDEMSNQFVSSAKSNSSLELKPNSATIKIGDEDSQAETLAEKSSKKYTGQERHRINFGEVGSIMREIAKKLEGKEIWLLLDEWSSIPLDLQPYLADLLRRTVFPISNIVVKIAAIEKRSRFQISLNNDDYLGIELGADASVDLSLDDFMVFDNDEAQAIAFYKQLLYKHFLTMIEPDEIQNYPQTADKFVDTIFSRSDVFKEYVRATEGIPRDAFSILSVAAQKSFNAPFTMDTIRKASKAWYQRDKESAVSSNEKALALLHWIIDKVISHRKARAFLLERGIKHDLMDSLFDSRVLHLLKKNVSAHDSPGTRYDVYKIDYGCYVDLLSTAKAPQGLFQVENEQYEEVPADDYRSIRRAILDTEEFERTYQTTLIH